MSIPYQKRVPQPCPTKMLLNRKRIEFRSIIIRVYPLLFFNPYDYSVSNRRGENFPCSPKIRELIATLTPSSREKIGYSNNGNNNHCVIYTLPKQCVYKVLHKLHGEEKIPQYLAPSNFIFQAPTHTTLSITMITHTFGIWILISMMHNRDHAFTLVLEYTKK